MLELILIAWFPIMIMGMVLYDMLWNGNTDDE